MRRAYRTKAHWLPVGVLGIMLSASCLHWSAWATADTPAPPVSCTTLTAKLSDNKNFYVFSATAGGDNTAITGYAFDFGDHQSYQFTFNPADHSDRHAATVTHTYRSPGTYNPTVRVNVKMHGTATDVSSDTCKTRIAILPAGSALPNTGARNILGLCVAAALIAAPLHSLWIRRRSIQRFPELEPKKKPHRNR